MNWEVRTMRSVTSCFNPTLWKKNLTRFWPIWALYGLIWLVNLPVVILNDAQYWGTDSAARLPLSYLNASGLALAVFFGLLAAMAVFSYLYNNRSVALLHTLPMTRDGLFFTNYLSGLSFLLLPHLAVFPLALAAEAMAGAVNAGSLCMWLAVQSLLCFFFYSFAVFCAMFTGHILALPAFYGILNILAMGLFQLFQRLAREFVYGYYSVVGPEEAAAWLTPAARLLRTMRVLFPSEELPTYRFYGLHVVLLYALVGAVLTGLALLVYKRRQLETAGDVVSVAWVRPVFKYGVAVCCAIALGSFFYSIFSGGRLDGIWSLLVFLLLWGAAGYFIAEMLLRKRFWVFRQSWKGCVVLLACLIAASAMLEFDVTGFERRVPSAGRVASACISDVRSFPYDDMSYLNQLELNTPEQLALLERIHRALAEGKAEYEAADLDTYYYDGPGGVSLQSSTSTNLNITYTLTDGRTLIRSYNLPVTEEALADPDSPAALLSALINRPELLAQAYFSRWDDGKRLVDAEVTFPYSDDTGHYDSSVYVPAAALPELLEAVQADLAAGDLGRRYLLEDLERMENCYLNDLRLTFRATEPDGASATGNSSVSVSYRMTYTVTIGLQASASETLRVLEQYGVAGTDDLTTHAQQARQSQDVGRQW